MFLICVLKMRNVYVLQRPENTLTSEYPKPARKEAIFGQSFLSNDVSFCLTETGSATEGIVNSYLLPIIVRNVEFCRLQLSPNL